MSGRGLCGELRRVGCHEGERTFRIAAIFRQIEMHPSDQIPGWMETLQEILQACLGGGERRCESRCQLRPECPQDVRRQVFGPGHHGRCQHQAGELRLGGWPHGQHDRGRREAVVRRLKADRGHVPPGEIPPPGKDGRQGFRKLTRSEPQKSVSAAPGERLLQTRHGLFMHRRRVFSPFGQKMPVRRQT